MVNLFNLTIMEQISRYTIYRNNGCWEFHGRCNQHGYGQIEYQGRLQLVSHISFRLMKGKIPKGKNVLHHCDNSRCYNPDHLFLGTQKDNLDDMRMKGRDNYFAVKSNWIEYMKDLAKTPIKRRV